MKRLAILLVLYATVPSLVPPPAFAAGKTTAQTTDPSATTKPRKGPKGVILPGTMPGTAELTAEECTRLGGEVTANGDPNCKTNTRCKMTLANGDLRSICIDEVSQ